ncbi:uncharacterized protein LOC119963790 [Scyliorhinus canicula]|uniref:uncharacterized protein LOC119963790 n=1 Tax=Scyliorhinus canicula TaxID=7830 RepID=UPI0018F6CC4E|nr:uncharacterized protein LOC119963790 [Scyliorhinus canicula]
MIINGKETSQVLDNLDPDTLYDVSLTAIYPDKKESDDVSASQRTFRLLGTRLNQSPQVARVPEGGTVKMICDMESNHPKYTVNKYDVHWSIPGKTGYILHHYVTGQIDRARGLSLRFQPSRDVADNSYILTISGLTLRDSAVYICGVWGKIFGNGTRLIVTRNIAAPSNLRFSDITRKGFRMDWHHGLEEVDQFRISWVPSAGGDKKEIIIHGNEENHVFDNLDPDTKYNVSLTAIYPDKTESIDILGSERTSVVPAPSNLRFSDIKGYSFRMDWDHGLEEPDQYRISWVPSAGGDKKEMIINGNETSQVLDNLDPDTKYDVSLTAIYPDKKESDGVLGSQRTATTPPPSNLRFSDITRKSFRMDWDHGSEEADQFRISWVPSAGGDKKEMIINGNETSQVLDNLDPDTKYDVSLTAIYPDKKESDDVSASERTSTMPAPSNLRFSDITRKSFRTDWDHGSEKADQFRISWVPSAGGDKKEMIINGNETSQVLDNLDPDTKYDVSLTAIYPDKKESDDILGSQRTSVVQPPSNLRFSDITRKSFRMDLDHGSEDVDLYRISWVPAAGGDKKEMIINGNETSQVLDNLDPDTLYDVSLTVIYPDKKESDYVSASQRTSTIPAPSNLRFSDITRNSFRMNWDHGSEEADQYRISWVPSAGGDKKEMIFNGNETIQVLDNLDPDTSYDVTLTAIYPDKKESDDVLGSERTVRLLGTRLNQSPQVARVPEGGTVKMICDMESNHPKYTVNKYDVHWSIPGKTGYIVRHYVTGQIDRARGLSRRFQPSRDIADNSYILTISGLTLRDSAFYICGIWGKIFGNGTRLIVTRNIAASSNLRFSDITRKGFRMNWDHGLEEVDQFRISWVPSAGGDKKEIIIHGNEENHVFDNLDPDTKYNISLTAIYPDKMESIDILGSERTSVVPAPSNLRFSDIKGYSFRMDWDHGLEEPDQYRISWVPSAGGDKKEMIINGNETSQVLDNLDPDTKYDVSLTAIYSDKKESDGVLGSQRTATTPPPSNLRFSDITRKSFRMDWDHGSEEADQFRISWVPSAGGDKKEMIINGNETSQVLDNLDPDTKYDVSLTAIYPDKKESDDVSASERTLTVPAPSNLRFSDITRNSFRMDWDHGSEDVNQYRISWVPSGGGEKKEMIINGNETSQVLDNLDPDTLYDVSLTAIYPDKKESDGVSASQQTTTIPAPSNLRFSDITRKSFRIDWDHGSEEADQYRISWVPSAGGDKKEMIINGNETSQVLDNLDPDTKYDVSLTAIYPDKKESDGVLASQRTSVIPAPSNLRFSDIKGYSFRMDWDHGSEEADQYRISWVPSGGGDKKEMIINGKETSQVLDNLDPDTKYDVSLTAIYPDKKESDGVLGSQRTAVDQPPSNLHFSDITRKSFRMDWDHGSEEADQYRISWVPSGGGDKKEMIINGNETSQVLDNLDPDTKYDVSLTAIYPDKKESDGISASERTSTIPPPSNLRFSDITRKSFRTDWDHGSEEADQFRISWVPSAGGDKKEMIINGNETSQVLDNLDPDTKYDVSLTAFYPDKKESDDVSASERTSVVQPPSNLRFSDITRKSFRTDWDHGSEEADLYRISWVPSGGGDKKEMIINGNETSQVLDNLDPDTKYDVSLTAIYPDKKESDDILGSQRTSVVPAPSNLRFSDVKGYSFRLDWDHGSEEADQYRISWVPSGGGDKKEMIINGNETSQVLDNLDPDTKYNVSLTAIYQDKTESDDIFKFQRTSVVQPPSNLRFSDISRKSFRMDLDHGSEDVDLYRISWVPSAGGDKKEMIINGKETSQVLDNLDPDTLYDVSLTAIYPDKKESDDVSASQRTSTIPAPSNLRFSDITRNSFRMNWDHGSEEADQYRVSWVPSAGGDKKEMIFNGNETIQVLDNLDPDTSYDVTLTAIYPDKKESDDVLGSEHTFRLLGTRLNQSPQVARVPEGGTVKMTCAMRSNHPKYTVDKYDVHWSHPGESKYIVHHFVTGQIDRARGLSLRFQPSRDIAGNSYILIISGLTLRDSAVYICGVWGKIFGNGTRLIVTRNITAPSNLYFLDITRKGFRMEWHHGREVVDQFRISWVPSAGGDKKEIIIHGNDENYVFDNLDPDTKYNVSLTAIYADKTESIDILGSERTLTVPTPLHLRFSDVKGYSFQMHWDHGREEADQFRFSWVPSAGGDKKEMIINGNETSQVLDNLDPDTLYDVSLTAIYPDKVESDGLLGSQRTAVVQPPSNLRFSDISRKSFRMDWDHGSEEADQYRISWVPSGGGDKKEMIINGKETSHVLDNLDPNTKYDVSLTAIYPNKKESDDVSASQRTSVDQPPSSLRLSDVTRKGFRMDWEHAADDVDKYRISWVPSGGGDKKEMIINGNERSQVLDNLDPSTLYAVTLTAIYPDKTESEKVSASQRTASIPTPSNLRFSDITRKSFLVDWDHGSEEADQYKISWVPSAGGDKKEMIINGKETSQVLDNLDPDTKYDVSLTAIYPDKKESNDVTASQRTSTISAPSNLRFSDITRKSFRMDWDHGSEEADQFRISWVPSAGGDKKEMIINGKETSQVLDNLDPDTKYDVSLTAIYQDKKESDEVLGSERTSTIPAPSNLRFSDITRKSFLMDWDHGSEEADQYRISWVPTAGGDKKEVIINGKETSQVLDNLDPDTKYDVSLTAIYPDKKESIDVLVSERTSVVAPPSNLRFSDITRKGFRMDWDHGAEDVDQYRISWVPSAGGDKKEMVINGKETSQVLDNLDPDTKYDVFLTAIYPDKTESIDVLGSERTSVVQPPSNLRFSVISRKSFRMDWDHGSEAADQYRISWVPSAGGDKKEMIINGNETSQFLDNLDPDTLYDVTLTAIYPNKKESDDVSASQRTSAVHLPSNLRFSAISRKSFQLDWDHGSEEADQYRISWVPSAGGDKKETIINGKETSHVFDNLDPDTKYDVTLTAIYPDKTESDDVSASQHTSTIPAPSNLRFSDITRKSFRMDWDHGSEEADQYRISWVPSGGGDKKEMIINGKETSQVLDNLDPDTKYDVSLTAIYPDKKESDDVLGSEHTSVDQLPSNLRFSDISRKSFRMDWDHGAEEADQYRISWVPSGGGDKKEMTINGKETSQVLDNLDPNTKYDVTLTAIYPDKTESDGVSASQRTSVDQPPSNLRFSDITGNSFRMDWDHGSEEAHQYRISWVPSGGGDKKEMIINGNETSHVLDNLDPDTLYDVSLTAIYPDKKESEDVSASQRTSVDQPPSNLRFSDITRKSFRMDWDHGSEEADQYRISWVPSGGGDKKEMIINGKESSQVLDNLDPDTLYDVTLTAIYPNKKESDEVSASQRTSVDQPPSNLRFSDITRKSFRMDWDHGSEEAEQYRISWVPSAGGDKKEMIINGKETSQVLDNLDPDTLYDVTLTAIYPNKKENDDVSASQRTSVDQPPSNLRFSDITRKSFQVDWDHGSEEADQYRISWVPSAGGDKKEMIINGKETSQVLDNLDPDTLYDVTLTAIYPNKKESDDVSASQRTSVDQPPSNLRFSDITRKSFRVDWDHGSEEADQYRISWVPSAGGDKKEMIINGKETSQVLDNLDPDTLYDVSLTAIYPNKKESDEVSASQSTSVDQPPSNLRFSDITRKSFRVDWDHGSEEADQYRISWVPSGGGDKKEMIINGKETSQVLDNLDPDTLYDITLTAIYPNKKESDDVAASQRTSVDQPPSNLRFSDITRKGFRLDWDHGSEEAHQYRISWVPSGGGDKKEMIINGKETSQVLGNLDPDTLYDVTLTAIYPNKKKSDEVSASQRTSVDQPPSNLRFSDITRKSFRMDWDHGSEEADQYRISWVPSGGGDKKEIIINGNETSQVLDNLDPDTKYDVSLTAIYPDKKESEDVSASQRTSVVPAPSNLRFSDVKGYSFRLDWDHGSEEADQYRISWVPSGGGDKKEMIINGNETSQVLDNLDPDTKYDVSLTAIYPDKKESDGILGSQRTAVVAPPSNLRLSDITRKSFRMDWDHGSEEADQYRISWVPSGGGDKKEMIINGNDTSQVLDNLNPDTKYDVSLTAIYPDKKESDDVSASERTSTIPAPSNLRFSDITRKSFRMDWDHGSEEADLYRISWVPSAGGDKKEMIINGNDTSQVLDNLDPDTKYDVSLTAIYPDKKESDDVSASERTSTIPAPSNLRFSDIMRKIFRMDWDHGSEEADLYRISWVPSAGGDKKEMIINGNETSQVLDNLDPDTKYDVSLTAIYPDKKESDDVSASERTSTIPAPSNLRFSDITRKSFRMDWDHGSEEADLYRISWVPSAGGDKKEMIINGNETSQVLDSLDPDTKYDVSLTAIYPDKKESDDVSASERTSTMPAPSNLCFSDITRKSFRMDWDHGSEEADLYRISWVPSAGGDKKEMIINGNEISQVLDNLNPDTKYDVSLTAIYPDKKESDDILGSQRTSVVPAPSNLRFSDIKGYSFRLDWDHGSEEADQYRISWVPSAGGDKKEMIINGNETSQVLDNLDPDTLYDVSLTAIYPDKKESDDILGSERTSTIPAPSNLRFSDITRKSFRMDWDHGSEEADQYRISWVPSAGGDKKEMIFNGNETSQVLDNLDPDTLYDVSLTAIYPDKKESEDVLGSERAAIEPVLVLNQFPQVARVPEGGTVKMMCDMRGTNPIYVVPKYDVHWSHPGERYFLVRHYASGQIERARGVSHRFQPSRDVARNSYVLTISGLTLRDSAVFLCGIWGKIYGNGTRLIVTRTTGVPSNLRFSDITRKGFRVDWDHGSKEADQYRISWVPSAGGDKKEIIKHANEDSHVFDNLDPDTKYNVSLTAIYPDKTESTDLLGSERTLTVPAPSNLRFSDVKGYSFRMDWDHGSEAADQYRISWVPSGGGDKKEMIINGNETSQVLDNVDPDTKYDVSLTAIYPDKMESADILGSQHTAVVAPPSNLRFSDIRRKGFRMDWEHGSDEMVQYRISWVPSAGGNKKEMIINGNETSLVLDNLDPDTNYDVTLTTIYPYKKESDDISASQRTSVVAPPLNLRFSDITRKGFRMDWDHGSEDVDQYRISWVPSAGGDKKEMIINGKETSQVLDNLDPATKYDVSLTAIYPDKTESDDVLGSERTSVVQPPSNLRFSDISRKSFRMDWDHGSEEADQYRISWVPSAGGDKKEMIINGKETSQVLENLNPDTKYDVSLTAIYPDKTESEDVSASQRTAVVAPPSNLRFSDITRKGFRMDWDHGAEDVDQYRISWVPSAGGDKKEMIINGNETSQVLDNLDPDTKYDVSLTAIYPDKTESADVSASQRTLVVQPPSNLRFSDISRKSFRMDWDHGSEEADQYRISWVPSGGGDKKEMIINGKETSQVLENLNPDTLYDVTLTAIYPDKTESDGVSASQRTSVVQPPSNLRFSDITKKSFRMDWDHGSEEADQYRISWVPSAGGDKKEVIINGKETSQVLDNLDPDTKYDVTLTAIYPDKTESDDVLGSERTSVVQPTSNLRFSDITRKSFRMDWDHGSEDAEQYRISWVPSAGGDKKEMIINGKETSQVLDNLDPDTKYDVFLTAIYPDKTESDDVLGSERTSTIPAPSNLRFSDITRKGFRMDWDHGSEEADKYRISWVPSAGGDKKEMIINGNETSQVLDNLDPDTLYDVSLTAIYPDKMESEDVSATQRTSVVPAPSNLRFSDIKGHSFRMDWDHGPEEADQYRISWVPSAGGDKKEMIINGNERSQVLDNLDPDTLYDVTLTAISPNKKESEDVSASQRTSVVQTPSNLRFSDITRKSFRMNWNHGSEEADQYRISWVPSAGGDKKEMIINGNETSQVLDNLDPDTKYDVTLTAIYPDKTESADVSASERTSVDQPPSNLRFSDITRKSFRMDWDHGSEEADQYRISWVPSAGGDKKEMIINGKETSQVLDNLDPDTLYDVTLNAIYPDKTESDGVSASQRTSVFQPPSNLRFSDITKKSFRMDWDHGSEEVDQYRISWVPSAGGDKKEMIINGNETSQVLDNLDPDTKYDVTLTAIYPDKKESDDIFGSQRTSDVQPPSNLRFSDITKKSFRMDWDHGSEEADQYRISWVPSGGGDKKEMIINGKETSQVLDNLDPDTLYDVSLTAIYPDKTESDGVSASQRTSVVQPPSNLRFSDITKKSFRMDWDHGSEEADQYRISWVPSGGGDKKEMIINGKETSQVLDNLDPDTLYDVTLTAIYPDKTESDDVSASQRTSVVQPPSNLRFSDITRKSFRLDWDHGSEEADQYRISWVPSGGGDKKEMIINGNERSQVLDNLDPDTLYDVSLTAIYPDKTESDDVSASERTSVVQPPSNLRFSDITGNSFRMDWDHGSEEVDEYGISWVPSGGGDKKEMIISGKETSQVLDNLDPDTLYDVSLTAIYPDKMESDDVSASQRTSAVQPPSNLRFSDITGNSFRMDWDHGSEEVDEYRISWVPSGGGDKKEMIISGKETSHVLDNLDPDTLYDVSLTAIYPDQTESDDVSASQRTSGGPAPSNLRFSDITANSFRMHWDHGSEEVDQYRLSWVPSGGGDKEEMIINGNETSQVLDNLDPDTLYDVSLTAIYPDKKESEDVSASQRTYKDKLGPSIIVPILTLAVMTYVASKILAKEGIVCQKPSLYSPAPNMTCGIRDEYDPSAQPQDASPPPTV